MPRPKILLSLVNWMTRPAKHFLAKRRDSYLRDCRSIVHVGANTGQERFVYESYRLRVLWVEPIPSILEELQNNIRPFPQQTAAQALITDKDGEIRSLNVASNGGASSSILDLALHKDIWPDVTYVAQLDMTTVTLDRLLQQNDFTPVDAIIIDTQGSEDLVLKGASQALSTARFVKVECADFEAYQGCATLSTLTELLGKHGFEIFRKRAFASRKEGGTYYDVVYQKI